MKRFVVFTLVMALLLSLVACGSKTIGLISGLENDCITIDDVKYNRDTNHDFSNADKGKYLGKVSNSKITMRVYSVKGDADGEYIYALWDWEGAFYKREENHDKLIYGQTQAPSDNDIIYGEGEPIAVKGDYPAVIMVEDVVYYLATEMPAEIDESAIIGYTNSYTDEMPQHNGEINFNRELNMPYARVEDGIAILYNNEWWLCKAK